MRRFARFGVTTAALLAALVSLPGCEAKKGDRLLTRTEALAVHNAADPGGDGIAGLLKLEFKPVKVVANGDERWVLFLKCPTIEPAPCAETPPADSPHVALFTTKPGLDEPIEFSGRFWVDFGPPKTATKAFARHTLRCTIGSNPALDATAVEQFGAVKAALDEQGFWAGQQSYTNLFFTGNKTNRWDCVLQAP